MNEEDEDIRLFREEYPDVYDFVLKVLDGNCDDAALQAFKDEYGEASLEDFLKIISGKASDKDIQAFLENYSDEIYNPILKMIQNRKHRRKDFPESVPLREKFKKGDFIGQKYEVFGVLGEGGFGIVYLVYSHETKSAYALKTFRHEYLEDVTIRERFKKEAQVWIELERHPYLVRAYFVHEFSNRLFIVLDYISSDETGLNTLEGYLRRRPPDLAQSLRWAIQFCYGMEYAYLRGIKAHRDIKPANIMIGQDKAVKISDFGLAGVISTSKSFSGIKNPQHNISGEVYQTMEGSAFGTPPYMPPEQFENAAGCDERSDLYSFGIVLYQMASGGKLPFLPEMAGNMDDNLFQNWYMLHCKASVPKLKSPLFPIIQKCLEKEPRKRYQSFKELRADLEPLLKQATGEILKLPELKELEAWEWVNKGSSLISLSKFEEAVNCFDRALLLEPANELIWLKKSLAFKCQSKPHDAILCVDKALLINPQNSFAWGLKGDSLNFLSRYEDAISCYDEALTIDPHDGNALQGKGVCLFNLKDYEAALKCFRMGSSIAPDNALIWFQKACTEDVLKLYSDVMFSFRRFLEKSDQGDIKRIQYAKQRLDSMK